MKTDSFTKTVNSIMKTTISPKLEASKNYSMFEYHPTNRTQREKESLVESMEKYGFLPSQAITCTKAKNGKLQVLRGHHRFNTAKQLGLPIYYIVENADVGIYELEGDSSQLWSANDFTEAYARGGDADYQFLVDFKTKHNLPMTIAASLVGGESAVSNNKSRILRTGTFKIGDLSHAMDVVGITGEMQKAGMAFASRSTFIRALSCALRVKEVKCEELKSSILKHGHKMKPRTTVKEYLDELEVIYNYAKRRDMVPLKLLALDVMRKRQGTFGRSPNAEPNKN